MKLTQEEKNKRIAEACGWREVERCSNNLNPNPQGKRWRGTKDTGSERVYQFAPNYFECLNVMHEAEKVLAPLAKTLYADYLVQSVDPSLINGERPPNIGAPCLSWYGVFQVAGATAAQRAEAFGLTLKLWEAGQ